MASGILGAGTAPCVPAQSCTSDLAGIRSDGAFACPQVNLDSRTREETGRNVLQPTVTCFDEAQKKIFNLMEKDSYRRFLKSRFYLDLAVPSSGRAEKQKGAKGAADCASLPPQCA